MGWFDDVVAGKRALVRVDFNVPMENGLVTDDTRLRAAVDTVQTLRTAGAKVVLLSHFGRPKGQRVPELSLAPIAGAFAKVLGANVSFVADCKGEHAKKAIADLKPDHWAEAARLAAARQLINKITLASDRAAAGGIPVDAFWSLTMYDTPDFYLVDNPIDRYSIGDRTPGLVTADDLARMRPDALLVNTSRAELVACRGRRGVRGPGWGPPAACSAGRRGLKRGERFAVANPRL